MITQGMSDAVLSATPLERRMMLEEAAGVKQYRPRERAIASEVESTRENLVRVDALLVEIGPHLKNLKRQAEKASRGAGVAASLRAKQLQRFAFLYTFERAERIRRTAFGGGLAMRLRAGTTIGNHQSRSVEESSESNLPMGYIDST